ncbi:MAG: RNA polymerase sigma factor [Bacteroidia bacterium]
MKNESLSHAQQVAAFKRLFEEHYGAIRNFLYYKTGDMAEAQDLAQEAFSQMWVKRDHIRQEQAKNYLYTTANNLFINAAKHQQVVLRFQNSPRVERFAQDPQFELEQKEFQQRLEHTIASLPEKQREVFLMNRIEKMTYQEIATSLNLSVKAVEKRMHQALIVLRKLSEKI